MITDKCKKDFIKWLNEQEIAPYAVMFDELPINVKCMYIIEWFDSLEIYILPCLNSQIFSFDIKEYSTGELKLHIGEDFESRQESMVCAIEKANQIYNSRP